MIQFFALLTILQPSVSTAQVLTLPDAGLNNTVEIVSVFDHQNYNQPLLTGGGKWTAKGPGIMANVSTGDQTLWGDGSPEVGNFFNHEYDDGSMTGPASEQVFMLDLPIGTYGPPTPIKV